MKRLLVVAAPLAVLVAGVATAYVSLQEEPAPGPSLIGKDGIESWYKIFQHHKGEEKAEHIGSLRIVLKPSRSADWEYSYQEELDAEVRIPPQFEGAREDDYFYVLMTSSADARLDERFEPVNMMAKASIHGFPPIEVRLEIIAGERRIEVKGQGLPNPVKLSGGDTEGVYTSIYSAVFHLKQQGLLDRPGRVPFKILGFNQKQEKLAPYEVDLVVIGETERAYMGKMSKVMQISVENLPHPVEEMRLQTIYVDGFGRIVEGSKRTEAGELQILLVEISREARGSGTRVVPRGRRDPFNKETVMTTRPVPVKKGKRGKKTTAAKEKIDAKQARDVLEDAEKLIEDLRQAKEVGKSAGELKQIYDKFIRKFLGLREVWQKDVKYAERLVRLENLKKQAETYYEGARRTFEEAQTVYLEVMRLRREGDCDGMDNRIRDLEDFRERPELIASEFRVKLESDLIQPARKSLEICKIQELLRAKDLTLTGTIHYQEQIRVPVKAGVNVAGQRLSIRKKAVLLHNEAYALINGDAYRVGDTVKDEGVEVVLITPQRVQVSYKGQVRDLRVK
ncbi:MAG: hypothetical protein ACYTAF_00925 [Planctomycetota bacterium]|jgi:hypothetical protein